MSKIKPSHLLFFALLIGGIFFASHWKNENPDAPASAKISDNISRKSTTETPKIAKNESLRDSIVAFGKQFLGTPYVVAGCSKDGFDYSGFVYFVFQNFSIDVPRSSSGFENFGQEIPIEDVKKGDVLVFLSPTRNAIGHIGIVSVANGKNSDFIHSSSGREMQVITTNLANSGYAKRFVKAVKVIK